MAAAGFASNLLPCCSVTCEADSRINRNDRNAFLVIGCLMSVYERELSCIQVVLDVFP